MGARNQYSSINFLGGFIEGISIVNFCGRFLHCCFWLQGKLVEYPRLLIISPRSSNNFWNFPRCAKCKLPLHGPRNCVDRTWERSANYSAHTFPCWKPLAIVARMPWVTDRRWKIQGDVLHEVLPKTLHLHVSHTARLSPPKSSTPTTVSNFFANSPKIFHFLFFSKKQTHTIGCNNRPNIVDLSYRGRTKVAFWFGDFLCAL